MATPTLWELAVWGAFGGVAVEAIEILGAVKRVRTLPWKSPGEITLGALAFTVALRLGIGAGLAVALGQAGQISGGIGAVAAGVGAPLILEQMGKQLAGSATKPAPSDETTVSLQQDDQHRSGAPGPASAQGAMLGQWLTADPEFVQVLRASIERANPPPGGPSVTGLGPAQSQPEGQVTPLPPPAPAPLRHDQFDFGGPHESGSRSSGQLWPLPEGTPVVIRPGPSATESFDVVINEGKRPEAESGATESTGIAYLAKQIAYGLTRSTPAFGGTDSLD